ncbi:MAG: hypothetical protein WAL66_07425, partial [Nitrososphaeraceae archaeon]
GGFKPTNKTVDGRVVCGSEHKNINGSEQKDYVPHLGRKNDTGLIAYTLPIYRCLIVEMF